jgi:hypothetical protein
LKLNLPAVAVHDLAIKGSSLVLATHGRSMWVFDDLEAVREPLPASATANGLYVYPVPSAVRWSYQGGEGGRVWNAPNPPGGARVYYWLKDEPKGEVTLEVLDASGRVVNTLSSKTREPIGSTEYLKEEKEKLEELTLPKKAGVQRAVWNLAWEGAEMIQNAKLDAGNPAVGPSAVPGTYTLRLTVDGKTATAPFILKPDPREKVSAADLAEQLRFTLGIRDTITRLTHDVNRLRAVRRQLAERNDLIARDDRARPLIEPSKALIARLDELEARLHNPKAEIVYDVLAQRGGTQLYSRLAPLMEWSIGGAGAPTQGMREVFAAQTKELEGYEAELSGLLGKDLAALNQTAAQLGVPGIYVPVG